MNRSISKIFILFLIFILEQNSFGQVGIGTTNPEGVLDLESTTLGLVYPKVALKKTDVEAPVINPKGGSLPVGTIVYNTNDAATAPNDDIIDVYPGLYAWNGSLWTPQFIMQDYKKYEQTYTPPATCQRITFDLKTEIDGLGTGNSFVPKYTGQYKIKVTTSFAAGQIKDLESVPGGHGNRVTTGTAEGNFLFSCTGPDGVLINGSAMGNEGAVYCHSFSTRNKNNTPNTIYDTVNLDASRVYLKDLKAGGVYNFKLECLIDQTDKTDFVGDGAIDSAGALHIGHDIPCSVEFIFMSE